MRAECTLASVLPSDFHLYPDWLRAEEADALFAAFIAETPWEDPLLRIAGRTIAMPRRVAFFGPHAYAYSGILHPARNLPPRVEDLRRRVEATAGQPFNTVLMNLYRSGADSVSWHSDDDYPHGGFPTVASVSLGVTRRFRIAHRREKRTYDVDLGHGSLLVMAGRSQLDYRHSLPRRAAISTARVNLTFRYMAESNA
jgi:alkylated DNA repair dioxygenase AlkB